MNGQERDVTITLSGYQRDNLLVALAHIVGYRDSTIPAARLHTGDWTMELAYALGFRHDATDWGSPNQVWTEVA